MIGFDSIAIRPINALLFLHTPERAEWKTSLADAGYRYFAAEQVLVKDRERVTDHPDSPSRPAPMTWQEREEEQGAYVALANEMRALSGLGPARNC